MKDLDFITGRHLGLNTEFPLKIIIPSKRDRNRNYRRFNRKQLLARALEVNKGYWKLNGRRSIGKW